MIALRLSWSFARSAAVGMIVALMLAAAVPAAFGGKTLTVMSGSMEPNISTGDLVMAVPISPTEAKNGEVLTFPDPDRNDRLLTHRVASASAHGDTYSFVTQGDANNTVERWNVPADGRIGRVVLHVPKLGYLLTLGRTPAGRIALITVPALMLAAFALAAIWRPRRRETPDAPAAA
jgi:signal peptidase I